MTTEPVEPAASDLPAGADGLCNFIPEMGFVTERVDGQWGGRSEAPNPALLYPGHDALRLSALLTYADVLIGSMAAAQAMPRVTMTIDLDVRVATPLDVRQPFTGRAETVKVGRTINAGQAWFANVDDKPAVLVYGTFIASPRPVDTMPKLDERRWPRTAPPMTVPFPQRVGVELVEPGVATVDRRADTINLTDTLQGGVVALAAEEAACSLRPDQVPVQLDVRYLSTVRVGPARAVAVDHKGFVRVEVRDVARPDRMVAVACVWF